MIIKEPNTKLKRCSRCKRIFPLEFFSKDRKNKDGLQSSCKKCRKDYYHKRKDINRIKEKEWRKNNPLKQWAMHTRNNHKMRGTKIEISIKELETLAKIAIENGCYYCGNEMIVGSGDGNRGEFSPFSMTVDIIDSNEKIMSKENIRICCHSCNAGKETLTPEEYISKCENVVNKWKNT